MSQGLLLFAHGARDPRWAIPFDDIARRVRESRPEWRVELAYLEFMQPDLRLAGRRLADAGCVQVSIVPLFLGAGGHVRKDLPALMEELGGDFPGVQWQLRPAIGEVDSVIAAMAEAAISIGGIEGAISTEAIDRAVDSGAVDTGANDTGGIGPGAPAGGSQPPRAA